MKKMLTDYKLLSMTTKELADSTEYSGINSIDSLLGETANSHWDFFGAINARNNILYFTFNTSSGLSAEHPNVSAFNGYQIKAVRDIMSYVSSVTGIKMVETPSGLTADIHFGAYDIANPSAAAETYFYERSSFNTSGFISGYSHEAYINIDNANLSSYTAKPVAGTLGYQFILHEVGHMLGLGHPFEGPIQMPAATNNTNNTIMSYNNIGAPKTKFMPNDLAALKWIYGNDGLGGDGHYLSPNTPPTANALAMSVNTLEDLAVNFYDQSLAFSDQDPGDVLKNIKIMSLPARGTLWVDAKIGQSPIDKGTGFSETILSGKKAVVGQVVDSMTKLTFMPAQNGNGDKYASFSIKVGDGQDFSVKNYAFNIDVKPQMDSVYLKGTDGNDVLSGDKFEPASDDQLIGGNGDDVIYGKGGDDRLYGENGSDTIDGGPGRDIISGGTVFDAGFDTVTYENLNVPVQVDLSIKDFQFISPGNYDDINNMESVIGTQYSDTLTGDGSSTIFGKDGNDRIFGATGILDHSKNKLYGGYGNDVISAGGKDFVEGGWGGDSIVLTKGDNLSATVSVSAEADSTLSYGVSYGRGFLMDTVSGFGLGTGIKNDVGNSDKLKLSPFHFKAMDTAGIIDGIDCQGISGHSIKNGIISFEFIDKATPISSNIPEDKVYAAFNYMSQNVNDDSMIARTVKFDTVAFTSNNNTYVFQDSPGGSADIIVELTGISATSIGSSGDNGMIWLTN